MKKVLLTLMSVALISTVSIAQVTNSETSGNAPSASGEGYVFNFNGNSTENCVGSHVAGNVVADQTWTIDETNHQLNIVTAGSTSYPGQVLKFSNGNCVNSPIDLTTTGNQKFSFKVNASAACQLVLTFYNSAASQATNGDPNVVTLAAGDNVISSETITGMSGITTKSDILSVALVPRTAWDNYSFSGTLKFDYFTVGDATVTSTATSVDNSLVSVYPNPAKDQITLDLSSVNVSDASVKIMNANGMVVYDAAVSNTNEVINTSSFLKGMYMVQVTAGNKISNKKLIVQ